MKKLTSSLVLLSLTLTLSAATSFAAEKKKESASAPAVSYSEGGSAGSSRWGAGVSTYSAAAIGPSAVAMIDMDGVNMIQLMFSVQSTSSFQFDVGGLYKHKLTHGGNSGFHVGGGVGLGTAGSTTTVTGTTVTTGSDFTFAIAGVAGIHYNLPGTTDLILHLDAGPILTINNGNAQFQITPLSAILGATIVYMF